MLYVFQTFWLWLLAALIMGCIVGWLTFSNRARGSWWHGWVILGAILFLIAIILALTTVMPTRGGVWVETAILFFIAYILGCFLGGLLKVLFGDEAKTGAPSRSVPQPARPQAMSANPPPAAALPDEHEHEGVRPAGFAAPRGGTSDDLKLISGIGHQNEGRLHGLGIWHFDQIASWSEENVLWAGSYLAFPGRIEREHWVAQAKDLAAGKTTEFAKRAKAGLVKTSRDDGSLGQRNIDKID